MSEKKDGAVSPLPKVSERYPDAFRRLFIKRGVIKTSAQNAC